MELSNALKSLLATLTTKTTAEYTDGVMLANIQNGTPSGKTTIDSLFAYNDSKINRLQSGDNLNNLKTGKYASYATGTISSLVNAPTFPSGTVRITLFCVNDSSLADSAVQLLIDETYGSLYERSSNSGTWTAWRLFSVQEFLKPYTTLAALATGIMGQNISSITAAYFQGTIAQAVFDNVFIAVTRLSDTYPLAVKPKDWSSYSSASAYHVDGVLLVSGDKHLVIAPSEASLRWGADSDSHAASGNTPTSDRDTAMATFDGKSRTNTAVQVSEYADVTTACGYCHAFTTVTDAYDTTKTAYARRKASMWWLPSLGEMMMIWSNMTKINQVMSLIGGTPLAETYYWTSTEYSQTYTWNLYLSVGGVYGGYKKTTYPVRPVAAF